MNTMLSEILEMPAMAMNFIESSSTYSLPLEVSYLGMGSSYFAPLAFKYMGYDIYPELASEFYNYLKTGYKGSGSVLLSQSGRSTEVLWCAGISQKFTAISNDIESALCTHPNAEMIVPLLAGEEKYSSSKTYINTLLSLFYGLGADARNAVELLNNKMTEYNETGKMLAEQVFNLLQQKNVTGIYIAGSGPNIATAMQAALILSESVKINFHGVPLAQYDHGLKETAKDSILIQVLARGPSYERSRKVGESVRAAGASVFTLEEAQASENQSVLHNIVPFNFMAYYLAEKMNIKETFVVGGKVTEV